MTTTPAPAASAREPGPTREDIEATAMRILDGAFNHGLEIAARVACDGCLVPPDGGSPTEAERALCEEIARRILSYKKDMPH